MALLKLETATASPDAIETRVKITVTTPKTWRSMPDSVAPNPANRRSHLKGIIWAHPAWTAYSIVHVRSTAPQKNHAITPTEIVGFLNRLVT